MANHKWGRLEVGTVLRAPEGFDDFERKLTATAYKRGLSVEKEGAGKFRLIPVRPPHPIRREIVEGVFDYFRPHPALAHYRTAKNRGFESHINKREGLYRVTIKKSEIGLTYR